MKGETTMWRKFTLGLALSGALLLIGSETAQAQRRGGRGSGVTFSTPGGFSFSYGDRGYGYGRGYGYDRGYYGRGYYDNWYGPRYNYRPYRYTYSRPYYSTPYYSGAYYYEPGYVTQNTSPSYQSFYPSEAQDDNRAHIRVLVPDADARVSFDGSTTQQRGMERMFVTGALSSGSNYYYTVRATWNEGGREVTREKQVQLRPGQEVIVDFRTT
jgi:uncharacterized protein (TIGR03000 family)